MFHASIFKVVEAGPGDLGVGSLIFGAEAAKLVKTLLSGRVPEAAEFC